MHLLAEPWLLPVIRGSQWRGAGTAQFFQSDQLL